MGIVAKAMLMIAKTLETRVDECSVLSIYTEVLLHGKRVLHNSIQ